MWETLTIYVDEGKFRPKLNVIKSSFIYIFICSLLLLLCVFMHVFSCVHVTMHIGRVEENLQRYILYFHHVGPAHPITCHHTWTQMPVLTEPPHYTKITLKGNKDKYIEKLLIN